LADQSQVGALLGQGIAAAKSGKAEQARQILLRVVELDETNVQGWLWLSSVVDDPADKFTCLHNVLTLDPDNQPAQLGLARLDQLPPSPDTQVVDPSSPLPPEDDAKTSSPKPTGRVSRYKRLSPRKTSKESPSTSSIENLGSAAGLVISRSDESIYSTSNTKPSERRGGARCPFCRLPVSVMAVACDHCQLPLVIDCPDCDTRIDVELSACPSCGRSMGTFKDKTVYFANLAVAYQSQKKHHNAVMAWEVVQLLDRDYPDLYLQLAKAQAGANRSNDAIQTLRSVLEAEPGQEAASLVLGEIYHNLGTYQ
jgi:tetratricopeptide (TPR) repeat protein